MNQKPSFTAKPARDAEENKSRTGEDAKALKENRSKGRSSRTQR